MIRYFPKTAAAWNTAMVELQRWNNSRAVVCRDCNERWRVRAPLAPLLAMHHRNAGGAGHRVKVSRFG